MAKKFGMLAGVFTPTFLTILGVIMFIRLPWVVGNAGVLGAITILFLSVAITFTTALSLSSITTNIRIGAGGAFSLISQSLGLEIGGAIGIPFFFSQAIAVAMYVFGFREGLTSLFPEMNALVLDVGVFLFVMAISFISTSFAFKIQYLIMAIIILALGSIVMGLIDRPLVYDFQWLGTYPGSQENNFGGSSFWIVFAVFFPAVTGVMAGANMSGDLEDPRKSIPKGTISAVVITTLIYLAMIFVAPLLGTTDEMVSNYNFFIDLAIYPPIVLAGLLGATLSSALGSFVGAPRILLALGEKDILPKSEFLKKVSKKGEPRNAMMITAVVVILGLLLRDLNAIAPLITMFFMITYCMVNVVALIEQSLSLPSFRPSFKISIWIPIIGSVGSLLVMFIISPLVALASIILIIMFYFYLVKKHIKSQTGDSRSGLFTALAEWATKKTNELSPNRELRAWRPDLLIPVAKPKELRGSYKIIESIVAPKGSVKTLGIISTNQQEEEARLRFYLKNVAENFKTAGILSSYSFVKGSNFLTTVEISMQSLEAAFFKPNTLFLTLTEDNSMDKETERIITGLTSNSYGMLLYAPFANVGIALEKNVSLWLDIPKNWETQFDVGNNDLAILISLLIQRNWNGNLHINLLTHDEDKYSLADYAKLFEIIRFPKHSTFAITNQPLKEVLGKDQNADLNILSMADTMPMAELRELVQRSRTSALIAYDSGLESALI